MGKRKKLGDIVEIPLGNGLNAYARLYREGALGIYKGKYHGPEGCCSSSVYPGRFPSLDNAGRGSPGLKGCTLQIVAATR